MGKELRHSYNLMPIHIGLLGPEYTRTILRITPLTSISKSMNLSARNSLRDPHIKVYKSCTLLGSGSDINYLTSWHWE